MPRRIDTIAQNCKDGIETMKLSAADVKAHPRFAKYVSNKIPELVNVAEILNALERFSGNTSKPTIKKALQWGYDPLVVIEDLKPTPAPGGGTYIPYGG